MFNLFEIAINWMDKRRSVVALSTTKVEYMVATHAKKEVVWLQRLCLGIGFVQQAIRLGCDSYIAIFPVKNLAYHFKISTLMFNITL